jgi:spore cortex formation protein SpoVR/YcgB (stage V sporulation)
LESAGRVEYLIPNKTNAEESTSVKDSIASATNANEFPKIPVIPLATANMKLPIMLMYVA